MFSNNNQEDRVASLLLKGHEYSHAPLVTDENMAQSAIDLFSWSADNKPGFLIGQLILYPNSNLAPLALAILICKSDEFCQDKRNQDIIIDILLAQNPDQILEFTKYVKVKVFGSGLGSQKQKLLRHVMESWTSGMLKEFCKNYSKSTYALTRLIHPRYKGERGKVIQELLNTPPK